MFFIYGRQTARIKKYTDNQHSCKKCRAFDIEVKVYRDYYHLYYIPVCPIGSKTANARCNSCGEPMRLDSMLQHYESIGKTPFYLFSLPILIACIIGLLSYLNINTQKEKQRFVEDPKVGDVYTIRRDQNNFTTYYFLKVISISSDTVFAYHNNLEYHSFISKLNDDDYFVKDETLFYTKKELKQMLERMEINAVDRNYGDYQGFDRMR